MAIDDMRDHLIVYGYYVDDWSWDHGKFASHHYVLDEEYVSEACSCTTSSTVTLYKFLYPFKIKKTYAIEGMSKGEFTIASSTASSAVTAYRVTICKMHSDETDTELKSTQWVTLNDVVAYDAAEGISYDVKYPFWIDIWEEVILEENEQIYVKLELEATNFTVLHYNDSTFNDFWIDIPIRT